MKKTLILLTCLMAVAGRAAYIAIEDLRAGLDARKGVASALAGSLREALNGHITPGGEFEKRKAFVLTSLPTGTYGLEATTNGLVTFGSDADPGGWPRGQVVQYQRLQHPAILYWGTNYNATYHNMTGVVWSVCHEGLPFVSAAFSDGLQFLYYNGQLVTNSAAGLILSGIPHAQIRKTVRNQIVAEFVARDGLNAAAATATGYYYYPSHDYEGAQLYGVNTFSVTPTVTTTNNSAIWIHERTQTGPAYGGVAAYASYNVSGSAGKWFVFAGGSPSTTSNRIVLTGATNGGHVDWSVSDGSTATAIASQINAKTTDHGYSADSFGNLVVVYAPIPDHGKPQTDGEASFTNRVSYTPVALYESHTGIDHYDNFTAGYKSLPAAASIQDLAVNGGNWTSSDSWRVDVTTTTGSFVIGKGNIAGRHSVAGFSHQLRVYLALSNEFGFSSVLDPTKFEDQDTGAGVVSYSSTLGALDTVQGIGEYQGGVAVAGRQTTQLWNTDPNPADFYLRQTLPIGTVSGQTIAALGKLDTLMLADSGVRSLRVRDSSGNAIVEDVGTPIDSYIQTALAGLTEDQKRAACAVVEPAGGRYWVYIPGNYIYVFSFHPLSGINAWSRYAPTYIQSSTNTWFAPQTFKIYNSQVFARSTNAVYAYGGTGGTNYDNCQMVAETPFLNGNTPGTYKSYNGLDLIAEGIWTAKLGANLASEASYTTVIAGATNNTVTTGRPGLAARATHFKLRLEENSTGYARMSSVLLYYQPGDSR